MSISGDASWVDQSTYKVALTTQQVRLGKISFDALPPVAFQAGWKQTISGTNGGILRVKFGDETNYIEIELVHGTSSTYNLYHNTTLITSVSNVNIYPGSEVEATYKQVNSYASFKLNNVTIFNEVDLDGKVLTYENGVMEATGLTYANQNTTQIMNDMFLIPITEFQNDVYIARGIYAEQYFNLPVSPQVQADWNQTDISSNSYIKNKPAISTQVQADWNQTDISSNSFIKNKPTNFSQWKTSGNNILYDSSGNVGIGTIPYYTLDVSGNIRAKRIYGVLYSDISGTPTFSQQVQSDWNTSDISSNSYIKNKPIIPTLVKSNWADSDPSSNSYILNKPNLSLVAISGNYNDLINKPDLSNNITTTLTDSMDIYLGNDKTPPYRTDNAVSRENLYTWQADNVINPPASVVIGSPLYSRFNAPLSYWNNTIDTYDYVSTTIIYNGTIVYNGPYLSGTTYGTYYRGDYVEGTGMAAEIANQYYKVSQQVTNVGTQTEPFYTKYSGSTVVWERITLHGGATLNNSYYSSMWNSQYMIGVQNVNQDVNGNISTPSAYVRVRLPVKPNVSHAVFLKFISYDRWSSCCVYVGNQALNAFYRLQCQTNSYQTTTPYTSWIGPNGEMSASHLYHEWQMFSIPQYIIDTYMYDDTNDTKSKYGKCINICFCRGVNDGGTLWWSGIAMRPNPYGLTFHGALALNWATNGGNASAWNSNNWNNENLNQWTANTNYVNIRVPICPPKNPASNAFPDFYLVFIAHVENWDSFNNVYLYNPSNGTSLLLGKWSKSIKGRYGSRLTEINRHAMGVVVPSPDPQYIVYVGGRPYLNIRYDTNGFGHNGNSHCRGVFTEVIRHDGTNNNYTPYTLSPIIYSITSVTISANQTNFNLYNYIVSNVGTPSSNFVLYVTINSGVTIGSTSINNVAFDIGLFQNNSIINIVNNGSIQGAGGNVGLGGTVYGALPNNSGGATSGGQGGTAIKANYTGLTVSITNNGTIYGGGGGGGGGGKGANGVNGTPGYLVTGSPQYGTFTYWYVREYAGFTVDQPIRVSVGVVQNGVGKFNLDSSMGYSDNYLLNLNYYNGYARGSYSMTEYIDVYSYRVKEYQWFATTPYSATGGIGGNGGTGAVGRGYNNSIVTGSTGSSGTGQDGPPISGATSGQTGGSGGNGGDWGSSGSIGGGLYGAPGGSAGYYLVKGSANVTLTNNAASNDIKGSLG